VIDADCEHSEITGGDAEERSIVLALMDALAYSQSAWVPYLTYPANAAPEFHTGYIASIAFFVAQFGITLLVWWMHQRDLREAGRSI
jgi:ACS family pantothenate transporter-like MFS transporter